MKLQILATWGNTPWYAEGERLLEIDWDINMIPMENQSFNVHQLMKEKNILPNRSEIFEYQGNKYNVFQWIENEHIWSVKQIIWFPSAVGIDAKIVLTDSGYF